MSRMEAASRARMYAKSLGANWIGYAVNLAVMFFLSPFVVHRLGPAGYGVWTLLVSLTGYLGLIELGMRGGLGRFINYHLGKKDVKAVNEVISTTAAFFIVIGVLLVAASIGVAFFLDLLVSKIPGEMLSAARVALVLAAVSLWLSFVSVCCQQVLTAFTRFDLLNIINVVALGIRAGGTVVALTWGWGLVGLAGAHVVASVVGVLGSWVLAGRVFRELRIGVGLVSAERFRELFGFGVWGFLGGIAWQILYYTDTVVIMVVLGPEQVAFYAVAGMLIIHSRGFVDRCSTVFSPRIIQDCARQDWTGLRDMFRKGSTLTMGIGIVLLVGLIVFGREFIGLWMGGQYAQKSYAVLTILTLSQLPAIAMSLGSPIFLGLNRVRLGAVITMVQAVLNFALTLVLVLILRMGIEGVAWGTFFPRVVFAVIAGTLALRWIGLSMGRLMVESVWRWTVLAGGFAVLCYGIEQTVGCGGWGVFCLKVVLAVMLYVPMALMLLTDKSQRLRWWAMLRSSGRWGEAETLREQGSM